jgi:hypothetical protein
VVQLDLLNLLSKVEQLEIFSLVMLLSYQVDMYFRAVAQNTGTPTQASVGKLYTISTTAGDTNNGRSKEGVTTTTTSGIAKVIGFADKPGNSIGQYARVHVTFPTSEFGNN